MYHINASRENRNGRLFLIGISFRLECWSCGGLTLPIFLGSESESGVGSMLAEVVVLALEVMAEAVVEVVVLALELWADDGAAGGEELDVGVASGAGGSGAGASTLIAFLMATWNLSLVYEFTLVFSSDSSYSRCSSLQFSILGTIG